MKTDEKKTWQRTKTPGLLRHRGGTYYGRFTLASKTFFESLETSTLEIAKQRFSQKKTGVELRRKAALKAKGGIATMGDLLTLYREEIAKQAGIGESTRTRYLQHADYIAKTWPGFTELRPNEIDPEQIRHWKDRALTRGTGYRPPGAKAESVKCNGSSVGGFRKAVTAMRRIMDLAVHSGALSSNPLRTRLFARNEIKDSPRKPNLPDSAKLVAIFSEIEAVDRVAGWSVEIADFCRFLAFTGCRLQEANGVRWADLDFQKNELRVNGTKTEAAQRTIPLLPDARALVEKIWARRERSATAAVDGKPYIDPQAKVLGVSEASKSLSAACAKLGVERLTHHDLRDAFCSACLHAGVPVVTVAKWAGHSDGGALLLKRYAHVPDSVSHQQAAKVNFGGVS